MTSPDEPREGPTGDRGPVARLTPYELVFTEGEFEGRLFPRIDAEAAEHRVDTRRPARFDFLTTVADLVRGLTPDEAPPDALDQYRSLLFHAFHFWKGGRRIFVAERATARFLVEAPPPPRDWPFAVPADAGYLQLPRNLFWSSISPDAPPEPVDGFFFTVGEDVDAHGHSTAHLHLLFVLGVHRTRAGFSVIDVEAEMTPGLMAALEEEQRPDGDFANTLPGGEIEGLYSIVTVTEALKLAGRAFRYVDRFPDAVASEEPPEPRERDDAPPPSHLPFRRITLVPPAGSS